MFSNGRKLCFLAFCLGSALLQHYSCTETVRLQLKPQTSILANKLLKCLNNVERSDDVDVNMRFSALLSEFIIKQKVRFYESTRFENQIYYKILQKLHSISARNYSKNIKNLQKRILENVFKRDVHLTAPVLRRGQIDIKREYRSLIENYEQYVKIGSPNSTLSDFCMDAIVTISTDECYLLSCVCLNIITSDIPTFGYQRMHQILLLYVLMHHKCGRHFGSQAFNYLASQKCSEAYRERNVIKNLSIPTQYRDLYIEQHVICSLFGYVEFLNWPSVDMVMAWTELNDCACKTPQHDKDDKICKNHSKSMAIVYLINALLLLN